MKKKILMTLALTMLVALVACSGLKMAKSTNGHPPLSVQERLIACSECHQEVTPEIYSEWYASTHGIGQVKCYQCYGTYENLLVTPDMSRSCDACHNDKMGDHTTSMTGRISELMRATPYSFVEVKPNDMVEIESRRGKVVMPAKVMEGPIEGTVFAYWHDMHEDRMINKVVKDSFGPGSKEPEFKICACRIRRVSGPQALKPFVV